MVVYTTMASLQAVRAKGHTYWRIVESRRVNGKPRPVPIEYLGRTADILARLQGSEALRVRSRSHGAVAALYSLCCELDVAGIIDRHLVAIGRACRATSKRAFADWANTTTLGELAGVNVDRLTSQHFWDQMDQLPVELIGPIEQELIAEVLKRLQLPLDTLLFDATNFFTFIASANGRCELPARGKQKQKRNDLRQVGVALLCSRQHGIPLWHRTYGGNVADATCFSEALPALEQRLRELGLDVDSLTVVYDKGNVSRDNQRQVDDSRLHYVSGLTVASQRNLVDEANPLLACVELGEGETISAYRTRRQIWGADRTLVVLVSERLREGQMAGVMQHVTKVLQWLSEQAAVLQHGKQ